MSNWNNSRKLRSNDSQEEIQSYVKLMKDHGIRTIIQMNQYISKYNLWDKFSEIKRENVFASGFRSIGISKKAYSAILDLYQTEDVITSHLVAQHRV